MRGCCARSDVLEFCEDDCLFCGTLAQKNFMVFIFYTEKKYKVLAGCMGPTLNFRVGPLVKVVTSRNLDTLRHWLVLSYMRIYNKELKILSALPHYMTIHIMKKIGSCWTSYRVIAMWRKTQYFWFCIVCMSTDYIPTLKYTVS